MSPREKILADALALSVNDREWLAHELREMPVALSPEDRAELDDRIAAMERGEYEEYESIDAFMKTLRSRQRATDPIRGES